MDAEKVMAGALQKQSSTQSKGLKTWRYFTGTLALLTTLSLAGCYGPPLSDRATGTLIGGAAGVGGGALVGSAVGSRLAGAAIGGLGGAGLGYLIGNSMQHQQYGYGGYGNYGY